MGSNWKWILADEIVLTLLLLLTMIDDVEGEPARANQCSSICAYKPSNRGDNSYSVNSGKLGVIIGRTFAILPQRSRPRSLAVVTKVRYRNSINAVAC